MKKNLMMKHNMLMFESCDRIDELLMELGVHYRKQGKRIVGPCPVHGGDNPSAWSLYPNGEEVRGYWVCRTQHCEEEWGKNLIGLVHAIRKNYYPNETKSDTVKFLANFMGYENVSDVQPMPAEKRNKISLSKALSSIGTVSDYDKKHKREDILKWLQIPAPYFLNRGYSEFVLRKYDVGYSPHRQRTIVPVYDDNHQYYVGATSRTIYEKCDECGYCHDPNAQCSKTKQQHKWHDNFDTGSCLYNSWFARQQADKTSTLIIVEGPGDVWKLAEINVLNSVAIFGTELTNIQELLLCGFGVINIVLMLDNDDAGIRATEIVKEKLYRRYNIFVGNHLYKDDVGSMKTSQAKETLIPFLSEIFYG
jgi:5S rRNA maturation endonuclease (ribonuclease M5)